MKATCIILMTLNFGLSSCQGADSTKVKSGNNAIIKSEKIIYYNIKPLKNTRSNEFGRDQFLEYDNKGNLLKESLVLLDEDTGEEEIALASLTHYENGKQTKAENFSVLNAGKKREEIVYTYQKDGKLWRESFNAFEDGKRVRNKKCFYLTYAYGKSDTVSSYRFLEGSNTFELSYRMVKDLDNRKNVIKETYYDDENEPYRLIQQSFNSKNQLIKATTKDEYVDMEEVNTYNEQGDVIKSVSKNGETNYTYQYDEQGNWIEKTDKEEVIKDGKHEVVKNYLIKRTIVYH